MAKRTSTKGAAGMDAITLLKKDHDAVKKLFDEFEDTEKGEQEELATRICAMLTVHTTIEEELFYPAAREALQGDEEGEDMLNEANVEHASAKDLIAQIEQMSSDDERYHATVKVLGEYVKHHIQEEEKEMFPKLKKTKEMDLQAVGQALAQRKSELSQEEGLEEDEDEAAGSSSKGGKSSRSGVHARGSKSSSSRSRG